MDVSADLTELGRTPVAVVASGPKSILDIGRTLEYLVRVLITSFATLLISGQQETQGVPVISYSKTKDFPSFFTPKSGFKVHRHLLSTYPLTNCTRALGMLLLP